MPSASRTRISQVCGDWADTIGAYRFFGNEEVQRAGILGAHIESFGVPHGGARSWLTLSHGGQTRWFPPCTDRAPARGSAQHGHRFHTG
ncbi:transposase DNA-binding-containing protein [Verminephrobacter aporrectodeae]|uniref:transposase DNA-binding-containing protein n=1 Tax=Verminephrobacter aporrectodeae TaxID=1110389 RepID=UPI002A652648|nr:hypothetical protein [Verminephrobacter aporrectodeae subsp. tuberculatae]MCW5290777.1 hypothetical protein [Verminephrobacter aporrectodeae subsp. tuberculatae]MCW8175231.1 hypothetical protein [Verminephrobacter aporrectodeae subsp. tuberculatae]MCW8202668.1 hypothetical protein [Verminephrobacter aporrectodeae subsp. tuberculatae]